MKKSVLVSVKPLAMATAIAAGTTASMIAVALPGGDTSGASGTVTETLCQQSGNMTVTANVLTYDLAAGNCQIRELVPTVGFTKIEGVTADDAPVVGTGAMVSAGGELYESYAGADRTTVLLTPNRALMTVRSTSFVSGVDGSVSTRLGAAVQPSTGLQASWLTGTYSIMNRVHDYQEVASGLQGNEALGERNYTTEQTVTFNGDGTCSLAWDTHNSFTLTKDPMLPYFQEMDVTCTTNIAYPSYWDPELGTGSPLPPGFSVWGSGGVSCGMNDGDNYVASGTVNMGSTGSKIDVYDFGDTDSNGDYGAMAATNGCTYTVQPGKVSVTYAIERYVGGGLSGDATWTVDYDVSADLRYLVASGAGVEAWTGNSTGPTEGATLSVGVRVGAGDVQGKTYLFNGTNAIASVSTPNTASYEAAVQPTYQTNECDTRGSIQFSSTDVGGGFKACTMQSVSTCAGRFKSGYEETAPGANDGTIVDSLQVLDGADTAPSACRWSNTGGLRVEVDVTDPEANPITMVYTGDVSDNGEALVMQGVYNITGSDPDLENPILLPQMRHNILSYVVGQEYQGSLTADADTDGDTNYAEFVWAADVTPTTGVLKNSYNGDGSSDLMFRRDTDGQLQSWLVDPATGSTVLSKYWTTILGAPWVLKDGGDFNGDGRTDFLYQNSTTGQLQVLRFNAGGTGMDTKYWYSNAIVAPWEVVGAGDFNGDGNSDVMWRRTTDGMVQVWLSSGDGLTAATKAWVQPRGTEWVIKALGDLNGDGRSDVLWQRSTDGQMAAWIMGASGVTIDTNAWLPETIVSPWVFQGLADVDGDGGADLVVNRPSTDGQVMVWLMNPDGVTRTSKNWVAPIATAWSIVDTGLDYNADGRQDILYKNTSTSQYQVWLMGPGGTTKTGAWLSGPLTGWTYGPPN